MFFIMGEDIRLSVYGATANLLKEFGEDRVLDTPLSEKGFFLEQPLALL
ncbi:MAG: hypothetical protein Ct9H90mP2_06230 [Dehalococcoidia bacterium]|nr:MAG: hypothetical protein Ct9H90mP2_06230 [Dehalococcoidia bacterium]